MASLLQTALNLIVGVKPSVKRPLSTLSERQLIKLESVIGSQLFGAVSAGGKREFFCQDAKTWVWYEETAEGAITTEYRVESQGVLKIKDGKNIGYIEDDELENLALATRMYYERVMRELYKRDPRTGQLLTAKPDIIDPTP